MIHKLKRILNKFGIFFAGGLVVICVLGLLLTYLKPKQKLQTVAVNMASQDETDLMLNEGDVLSYICDTKGYPMAGIQVGVVKNGQAMEDTAILCSVFRDGTEELLSQTLVSVGELDDGQYVYIPFNDIRTCNGVIRIDFTATGSTLPGIRVNKTALEDAKTLLNGEACEYSLKSSYIYSLDYYPMMYDLLVLLSVSVGVFGIALGTKLKNKADEPSKEPVKNDKAVKDDKKKKRLLIYAGAALAILVLAALLEVFWFNRDTRAAGTYEDTYALDGSDARVTLETQSYTSPLDEETAEELRYQEEMNRLYYELLGAEYESTVLDTLTVIDGVTYKTVQQEVIHIKLDQPKYIDQMKFSYPIDESKYATYGVEAKFYLNGKLLNEYMLYDAVNSRSDIGYLNVHLKADEVELITYGDFAFDGKGAAASFISVFEFNWYRFIFLVGSGWILLFILYASEWYKKHLERMFLILALWFGTGMIVLVGCNQSGWDEHIHFLKAYEASFGSVIETPEAAMGMRGKYNPGFESLQERKEVTNYLRANDDLEKADISYQSRFPGYTMRAYIPQALALNLARKLHLPFDIQYMLGKFGNLLFYILALALTIRLAKTGKKFICILGLMPTPLFLASEYTYDAFITAFLFLGFILWVNEALSEEKMEWYTGLFMMLCFIAGSWSKQIYIFMILLIVFLPAKKFRSKVGMVLCKVSSAAVMLLILYSIFAAPGGVKLLSIGTGINYDLQTAGDVRVQGVSMIGQIQYILANPLTYTVLLLTSLVKTLPAYLLSTLPFADLAYNGHLPMIGSVLTGAVVLTTAVFRAKDEEVKSLSVFHRVIIGIMFFGVACVIWTSLYGTFSVVGAATIEGVQPRYYIPLMLPLMYMAANKKLVFPKDSTWYYRIIFLGVALLNIWSIYSLILARTLF